MPSIHSTRLALPLLLSAVLAATSLPTLPAQEFPLQRRLELVRKWRKAGRYKEAVTALKSALSKPDLPAESAAELQFELGQTYYRQGNASRESETSRVNEAKAYYARALQAYQDLEKKYPSSGRAASAVYFQGSSYLRLQDFEAAYKAYERVYRTFPSYSNRSRALLRAGVCLSVLERIPQARKVLKRVKVEFPSRKYDVKKARKYLNELSHVGRRAPKIRADSWLKGMVEGDAIGLFQGQVIVVVFFATWCENCGREVPHLRELIRTWADQGVVFLGVANPNDPKNTSPVDAYIEKNRINFLDVALDRRFASWRPYGVRSLPATALIDQRGIIRWRGHLTFLPSSLIEKVVAGK